MGDTTNVKTIKELAIYLQGENNLIKQHLEVIDEKLTKQNGSVASALQRITLLESNFDKREMICPNRQKLDRLEQQSIEVAAIKKYVRTVVVTGISVATLITAIVTALINHI